jgi:hypothetical protein
VIRGELKTFGLLPGAGRGLRSDRKVEALLEGNPELENVLEPVDPVVATSVRDQERSALAMHVGPELSWVLARSW